jgi:hypothetical protein
MGQPLKPFLTTTFLSRFTFFLLLRHDGLERRWWAHILCCISVQCFCAKIPSLRPAACYTPRIPSLDIASSVDIYFIITYYLLVQKFKLYQ